MFYDKIPDRYLEGMKFKAIVLPANPPKGSDGDLFAHAQILAFVSPSGRPLEWVDPNYKEWGDYFWKEE
jgi:hypothetical protein